MRVERYYLHGSETRSVESKAARSYAADEALAEFARVIEEELDRDRGGLTCIRSDRGFSFEARGRKFDIGLTWRVLFEQLEAGVPTGWALPGNGTAFPCLLYTARQGDASGGSEWVWRLTKQLLNNRGTRAHIPDHEKLLKSLQGTVMAFSQGGVDEVLGRMTLGMELGMHAIHDRTGNQHLFVRFCAHPNTQAGIYYPFLSELMQQRGVVVSMGPQDIFFRSERSVLGADTFWTLLRDGLVRWGFYIGNHRSHGTFDVHVQNPAVRWRMANDCVQLATQHGSRVSGQSDWAKAAKMNKIPSIRLYREYRWATLRIMH